MHNKTYEIQSLFAMNLMDKNRNHINIIGLEYFNQFQAKCPFEEGVELKSILLQGFNIIVIRAKHAYPARDTYFIIFRWFEIVSIPNTGCNTMSMNAICDNSRLEKVLLQIKYSISCMDIHVWMNRKLKRSNLLLK